jgi:hypothetical protein
MTVSDISYPNRSLGMRIARSDIDCAHDTRAWARVALANLLPGERVHVRSTVCVVHATSSTALSVKQRDGKRRRLVVDGELMDSVVRDAGDQLLGILHGVRPCDDVYAALLRDPAFHHSPGTTPFLSDNLSTAA